MKKITFEKWRIQREMEMKTEKGEWENGDEKGSGTVGVRMRMRETKGEIIGDLQFYLVVERFSSQ